MHLDISSIAQWADVIKTLFGIITSIVTAVKAITALARRLRGKPASKSRRVARKRR